MAGQTGSNALIIVLYSQEQTFLLLHPACLLLKMQSGRRAAMTATSDFSGIWCKDRDLPPSCVPMEFCEER
jgi:hypothetical protein